jgi:RNA polymerase sigma-70 factor (ECF subfamily)
MQCSGAPSASPDPDDSLRPDQDRQQFGALNPQLETTRTLLDLVRGGDPDAQDRLFRRFRPLLLNWAHNRLPSSARDLSETADLVQIVLMRTFKRMAFIEAHNEASFLAYLRTAFRNALRDELRRSKTLPDRADTLPDLPDVQPSVLEHAIGHETYLRYERALERLSEEQRQALILRVEFGYSNLQIAAAMGKASADAARMLIARAVVHLVKEMRVE